MSKQVSTAVAVLCALWTFGATMALGELFIARAGASPEPFAPCYRVPATDCNVNTYRYGTEFVTVDSYDFPLCATEDCSDMPGQIGVWYDSDGAGWLSLGEYSVAITD